jgi:hypothetical protein
MAAPVSQWTVQRCIRLAYRDTGLLAEGEEPNGEQYADGLTRLIDIINFWQTQGLKLWTVQDLGVPLVAGQSKYSLGPTGDVLMVKPLRVVQAYYLDTNQIRRPLVMLSREEWTRLSQITQLGQINSFFVDKQQLTLDVYFWLVPDTTAATGSCHLVTQTQTTTPVSLDDTLAFPPEWFMALRWALADELSTGQPEVIMQRCAVKAAETRAALEAWDIEDASVTFTPVQRAMYAARSFR